MIIGGEVTLLDGGLKWSIITVFLYIGPVLNQNSWLSALIGPPVTNALESNICTRMLFGLWTDVECASRVTQ